MDPMSSREELEKHYSPSRWSHRYDKDEVIRMHIKVLQEASDVAKTTVDCELGFQYGEAEEERLDIFGAKTLPGEAPIYVYIHGGYWQDLNRDLSSFMALSLCKAGAVVVVLGYTLAPQANLDVMLAQVKRGVAFVLSMAKRRGSTGVYLSGASAGAHMAAMLLATDWLSECMVSPSLIRGATLVAGIYDIRPLVNTYINDALKLTNEDAHRLSPLLTCMDEIGRYSQNRKVLVAMGDHECPAFQKNSVDMNSALVERNVSSTLLIVPDADHFSVIEDLRHDDNILTRETMKLMGLNLGGLEDQMATAGLS